MQWKVQHQLKDDSMSTIPFPLDDDLLRQAAEAAAAQGKSVEEFVNEAVRNTLRTAVRRDVRNGLPVMTVSTETPPVDVAAIRHSVEEEGF
jgi:Arc/MetJ family transcription regulator